MNAFRVTKLLLTVAPLSVAACTNEPAKVGVQARRSGLQEQSLGVTLRQYSCPPEGVCQAAGDDVLALQLTADQGDRTAEGLALVSNDAAVELVNFNLTLAKLNSDGRMIDLYEKKFIEEGCYPYIHDGLANLLYLNPSKENFSPEMQPKMLNMASYGFLCLDKVGQLAGIAIFGGNTEALKTLLTSWLPLAPPTSLGLGKYTKGWDVEVTARPDYQANIKKYDNFETSLQPSLWNAWNLGRKTTPADIQLKASKLNDSDLVSLYEISSVKSNAALRGPLEMEIFKRLEHKNVAFADKAGAFTDDGVRQIVADFKTIYPRLKNTNIAVIDTVKLKETIPTLGEGRHAFITNIPGQPHRTLVYVNNQAGKKYVFVSDSVGLSNPAYYNTYNDMAKSLKDQGYFFATDVRRQADQVNCAVFCMKDIAAIERHPELMDNLRKTAIDNPKGLATAPIMPAELLVTAQSISLLKKNHDIGTFFDEGIASGKPAGALKAEFDVTFVAPAQKKFDQATTPKDQSLALQELNFAKSYSEKFRDIYENPELRNLYFHRAAVQGEVPVKLGDYIDANAETVGTKQVNAEITKLRTILVSRAFRNVQP